MHRDIKPHNILINSALKKLTIIDWGLAEFYKPGTAYNVRVAAKAYKAPELLLGYEKYDYSVDLWGLGCIFAGIIFQQEPFFPGKDNTDQLLKIVQVLGTDELYAYISKLGLSVHATLYEQLGK